MLTEHLPSAQPALRTVLVITHPHGPGEDTLQPILQ